MNSKNWQEFKANRRLQAGILAVLLMVLFEAGMRWEQRLSTQQQHLQKLRAELLTVKAQSRNEAALQASLQEFDQARQVLDAKLWRVPSEAVGQARLNEWLTDLLKRSGVVGAVVRLSGSSLLIERREGSAPAADKSEFQEFRAVVRYGFTPDALEKVLAEIEAGDALSSLESLTVNKRERRVEFSVRVVMLVGGAMLDAAPAPAPAPAAAPGSVTPGGV